MLLHSSLVNEEHKQTLGARLRRLRIQQGVTTKKAAKSAGVALTSWTLWERGDRAYQPWRAPAIASALGVPVAQLFTDEVVLAEVRVSDVTLQKCRDSGRSAAQDAASRIAGQLEPLIWQEATRAVADVRPGARAARKRATRAEKLAGIRAADRARAAAAARLEIS